MAPGFQNKYSSNFQSKFKSQNCHKIASAYMIYDEAVTALAFQSGTLIVGFEDGQVKFLRKGAKKAEVAGAFHSSHVQDLKMISQDRFVTSAWASYKQESWRLLSS